MVLACCVYVCYGSNTASTPFPRTAAAAPGGGAGGGLRHGADGQADGGAADELHHVGWGGAAPVRMRRGAKLGGWEWK